MKSRSLGIETVLGRSIHRAALLSVADHRVRDHLVSSGSDEDIDIWLTYYADDDSRAQWRRDFPDAEIPERKTPPYDRDRLLPQAQYDVELPPEIGMS